MAIGGLGMVKLAGLGLAGTVALGGSAWWLGGDQALRFVYLAPERDTPAPLTVAPPPAPIARPEPGKAAPSAGFDLVRIEPDGSALVAGFAAPGARVRLRLDGEALAETRADPAGQYVAFLDLPAAEVPRILELAWEGEDGIERVSPDRVIVTPPVLPGIIGTPLAEAPGAVATALPVGVPMASLSPAPLAGAQPDDLPGAPAAGTTPQRAPEAFLARDGGLAPIAPQPLPGDAVAIDSIGYGDGGRVVVQGRSGASGTLRLLLDGTEVAAMTVTGPGPWRLEFGGRAPGTYRMRAEVRDGTGQITALTETPFLRAEPGIAAAPGVAVVTVQPGWSLWRIAEDRLGDGGLYVQVFEANRAEVSDPDLIFPGQVLSLPQ